MRYSINRRQMLCRVGGLAAGAALFTNRYASAATKASVKETKVISRQPANYHGWPTLTRRANGQLLLVCSGGRESHVCPFGRVELMRSDDDGRTWSWPQILLDGPIDDRDAGVVETANGSILVTTFTSLAYESSLVRAEKIPAGGNGEWQADRLASWQAAHRRLSAEDRKRALGVWMIRSTDGGVTWSRRYECLVNSPHGPIQIADGRLLYAGKDLWREGNRVGVCQSKDDGKTWEWLAEIPTRDGDDHRQYDHRQYHELHATETADNRIVIHIRNHNQKNNRETLQCESADGGKTWTKPRSIGVWGLPSHLTRLSDDRLLMSYGHRRKPYGNQARSSDDQGRTWSEPMSISTDGIGGDLGYPTTVQLADDSLVTV